MGDAMTLTVKYVHPNHIPLLWPQVQKMIEKALEHSAGEYTAEQLKVMLMSGAQSLLVAEGEDKKIYGAATISFENYPNDRIAFITSIGGKMLADKDIWKQFEDWCVANSCTKARGAAFEAVARLWHKRFGMEQIYVIVEKSLRRIE